jgi:hypothetical protein
MKKFIYHSNNINYKLPVLLIKPLENIISTAKTATAYDYANNITFKTPSSSQTIMRQFAINIYDKRFYMIELLAGHNENINFHTYFIDKKLTNQS